MTPQQITMMATVIAVEISECKDLEELLELKCLLKQVLATLETIICECGLKKFEKLESKEKEKKVEKKN